MNDPIRARLDDMVMFNGRGDGVETPSSLALRAVLDLHAGPCADRLCCSEGADHLCGGCHEERPCPTRAAIAEKLGVES